VSGWERRRFPSLDVTLKTADALALMAWYCDGRGGDRGNNTEGQAAQ
jgi:hypothetical protein